MSDCKQVQFKVNQQQNLLYQLKNQSFQSSKKQIQSLITEMKKQLSRKLFDQKQHQNLLLNQRQLLIRQFQSMPAYRSFQIIDYGEGSIYKGQVNQQRQRHGVGMLSGSDGSVYMGKWQNDVYHQYGTYLYPDGQRYEGEICQGRRQGTGKMHYLNGDIYEGEWIQDCRDGTGEVVYADGSRYQGQWRDNKPFGQGSYYLNGVKLLAVGVWHNKQFIKGKVTTQCYQGDWQHNCPHGKGVYKFQDGSQYRGDWRNGQKDGIGTYYFYNGDVYQGSFRSGLKHGKGKYVYSTGDVYQGQYFNDLKQGFGTLKFMNGDQYTGNWNKDLFHGPGTYNFSTRDTVKTNFFYGLPKKNGQIINLGIESQQRNGKKGFSKLNVNQSSFKARPNDSIIMNKSNLFSPVRVQKDYTVIKGHSKTKSNISQKNGNSNVKLG